MVTSLVDLPTDVLYRIAECSDEYIAREYRSICKTTRSLLEDQTRSKLESRDHAWWYKRLKYFYDRRQYDIIRGMLNVDFRVPYQGLIDSMSVCCSDLDHKIVSIILESRSYLHIVREDIMHITYLYMLLPKIHKNLKKLLRNPLVWPTSQSDMDEIPLTARDVLKRQYLHMYVSGEISVLHYNEIKNMF